MICARIILNNKYEIESNLKKLNVKKKFEFAFYDLIYLNKNGASITEDTLKIRVYQKNEWANKDVLVIRKTAPIVNGVKEDKVLVKKEFDNVEDAIEFVNKNFGDTFVYKIKLEKDGVQYENEKLKIWVENITDVGASIEFGSENEDIIEGAIKLFNVKERLNISVPEYLYKLLNK